MTEVASVLYGREDIRRRVEELGRTITGDYEGREPVLISVLKGGSVFLADLMRELPPPARDRLHGDQPLRRRRGVARARADPAGPRRGPRRAATSSLVEDIVDTGLTLSYLLSVLRARGPASIEVCALLDKAVRRIAPLSSATRASTAPTASSSATGWTSQERYRNLPDILAVDDLKALRADPDALVPSCSSRHP